MMYWLKQLRIAFGASFLWLVCLIYFTQGFRSFVWTAVSYQLKDKLKLSPSASQFVTSIAFFPWSIKPLYGILSDCIPIRGRKRIPYLKIASLLSLFPWLILSVNESLRSDRVPLMILLTVQNLGSAMADVVIDAMIAEAVRLERASFAGDLQSLSWMTMALGGICGSLLGGYALTNLQTYNIFLLFSALPAIQLFSSGLVEEKSVGNKEYPEYCTLDKGTNSMNGRSFLDKPRNNFSRRKRNKKSAKRGLDTSENSQIPEIDGSLAMKWFHSLKMASITLLRAFQQPVIFRPMIWFFLANVTVPNLSTVMFYYQTETLKLEASFLGTVRVVGWFGLMLGTFIYSRYLKKMKLHSILLYAHIGLSLLTLLDGVLVSRSNLSLGISDKFMVLFGSALSDGVNQFKQVDGPQEIKRESKNISKLQDERISHEPQVSSPSTTMTISEKTDIQESRKKISADYSTTHENQRNTGPISDGAACSAGSSPKASATSTPSFDINTESRLRASSASYIPLMPSKGSNFQRTAKESTLNPGAKIFSPSILHHRSTTPPAMPNGAGVSYMPDVAAMAPMASAQQGVDISSFAHPSMPVKFVPYNNVAIGDGGHDVTYVQPVIGQMVSRTQPVRYAGQYHNFQTGPGYVQSNPQNVTLGRVGHLVCMHPIASDVTQNAAGFSQPTSRSLITPHLPKNQGNASAQALQLCMTPPIIANAPQQFAMPSSIPISQPLFPVLRPIAVPRSNGFFNTKFT
ncbi:putative folate-biopterin transporter 4 isoform X2 [Primulina tabacum]|uniref:putative folate-biopterin transporter 4 isoform X2 n=1 Tax=Primulina tabacum TaxID=48773 RepID=UPI003F5912EE